jgi:hypothetical protein
LLYRHPTVIITTITTIITTTVAMLNIDTRSYQTDTPVFLWDVWTKDGPADDCERYAHRLTQLVAADVLEHCPDELTDDERAMAEQLAGEVSLDGE